MENIAGGNAGGSVEGLCPCRSKRLFPEKGESLKGKGLKRRTSIVMLKQGKNGSDGCLPKDQKVSGGGLAMAN